MTKAEHELNDHLMEMGWREGSATPERISSLLERLSTRNKLKLASVAIADTDLDELTDYEELENAA